MAGSASRILTDVQYSFVQFLRSRQALFFTLVFPGLLLVVLGYLLGYQSGPVPLYYVDQSRSPASQAFLQTLGSSGTLDLRDGSGQDLQRLLEDGTAPAYLEIPRAFGSAPAAATASEIKLNYGRSAVGAGSSAASRTILSTVRQAVEQYNLQATGAREAVVLSSRDVATSGLGSIDFLFPGILGMCIMFTAISETLSVLVSYRTTGLSQKLSATPLSTAEWNISKIVYGTLIMLLAVAVAVAVGWLALGVRPTIDGLTVALVIVGALMFVGLGMVVSNFVSDLKAVNSIAFSITLPLMLLSGSLFPVERLPAILQFASVISPLTCLNNGLRSAMVTGDTGAALVNLFVGAFLALVLFAVGVAILMKNDGQDM